MNDRYAQTVGFVVAGVGLAAAFLDWTPAPALAAQAAGGFAGAALLAFAARRHGSGPAWLDYAATAASAGLALAAAAGILDVSGALSAGPLVALFAGLGAVAAGAAAVAGVEKSGVRARERRTVVAVVASLAALVFGGLLASVAVAFLPEDPLVTVPVNTAVASAGYGIAGVAFVQWFDGGIDVSKPGRRDVAVAGVGVVAIFALHLAMNAVVTVFSLPQSTHGLVETAKAHPGILPPLAVVSLLFIGPGEELLARNGVQKYLYGSYSRYAAVAAASLVFTGSHVLAYTATGVPPGAVLVTLSRVFVVSLVLGVTYERTDDLFAPVVVHGVYDAVQFMLAYAAFS
ncbi:CPBP family intramembrane glutamic endopeptidase [Halobacterium litoreum]|uniref:CPBP family intramembrane glutamic endopeptidase n=1 Tax=Halobacterium litoreum TaxID=2039234 RepID=A0ABD5NE96_9EURY|nr:CPBP family intramembrane glutamic endopeptidase [Halobacterium litoreum]UHH13680.1 CPBP family intramembrane metalloprotease [Halobacterium litoreum]